MSRPFQTLRTGRRLIIAALATVLGVPAAVSEPVAAAPRQTPAVTVAVDGPNPPNPRASSSGDLASKLGTQLARMRACARTGDLAGAERAMAQASSAWQELRRADPVQRMTREIATGDATMRALRRALEVRRGSAVTVQLSAMSRLLAELDQSMLIDGYGEERR